MKNEKKTYLAPEIGVVTLTPDLITTSSGYDGTDNWSSDIFAQNP